MDAPNTPENIRIEFDAGIPVKVINHADKTVKTDSLDLFLYLNDVSKCVSHAGWFCRRQDGAFLFMK